jgi:hypothetical protein
MIKSVLSGQRLIACCLLGAILFNYPLLSLFSADVTWLGVPLRVIYLFSVWALLIGLMAFIIERSD